MQHTRQAPGRDIHRHFSLAQPVVIPKPQATRKLQLADSKPFLVWFGYFELEN